MTLPIDRTPLAAAITNQVAGKVASAQNNIDTHKNAYDTIDELNSKADTHAQSPVLAHPDGSVVRTKLALKAVGSAQLDDFAVTPPKIAVGAVGANQLDPSLMQNWGDIAVQAEFDRRGVNVQKYGAKGDGVLRTISSVFPQVTLSQVQALNASATLSNSADWYALQLALSRELYLLFPTGNYVIDLPLSVDLRTTIYGQSSTITNTGTGHCFIINQNSTISDLKTEGNSSSGSGMFIASECRIQSVRNTRHGRYGMEFSSTVHVVACYVSESTNDRNILGGVYIKSSGGSQKNVISFLKVYCVKNGNDPDNELSDATPTTGHGFYIDGGMGIGLVDCASEYNCGAGLYLDKATTYILKGFTSENTYFEQNKYTHIIVNYTSSVWENINVTASTYNNPHPHPGNSLIPTGNVIILDRIPETATFSIEGRFGLNKEKIESGFSKVSLKPNETFDNLVFPYNSSRVRSDLPECEGYNCLVINNTVGGFMENGLANFAKINPHLSYFIEFEYKCNTDGAANPIITFYRLDKNGGILPTTDGGSNLTISLPNSATFAKRQYLIDVSTLKKDTRMMKFYTNFDSGINPNSYLLFKYIRISPIANHAIPSGTTANRPFNARAGMMYFDSTLNKPIWANGSGWVDATGTTV